ncbi:DUF397 domain-containing protein [Embleya sp. NBC_00896]|uniref:DUF397 domain-containing protein n=1 Tax=Embleya sp. NBC_00896 TaxID=2975961 RepID=UPI00386D3FD0|nr:DUF397 domain-containing protein [Embleya sp. NBC_00896]
MSTGQHATAWRTSTYSGNAGGDCVEVAPLAVEVGVRDSKVPDSPVIRAGTKAWSAFLAATR